MTIGMPPTRVVPEFACSSRSDQRSHRDDRAYRPDVAPLSIRGLIVLGATSPVIDIEPITGFTSGGVASSERQNAGGASWRAAGLESEFVLHGSPDDATQASTFVTVLGDGLRVVTSNGVREVPQVGAAVVGGLTSTHDTWRGPDICRRLLSGSRAPVVQFTRHRHPIRRIWRGACRPALCSRGEPDRPTAVAVVPLADAAAGGCAVVRAGARDAVRAQPIDVAYA